MHMQLRFNCLVLYKCFKGKETCRNCGGLQLADFPTTGVLADSTRQYTHAHHGYMFKTGRKTTL